jgi:type II secretion system protein I
MRATRRGVSLLEIILALALLAGAVAVLSELSRGGLDNAGRALDMTQAELLCESKLAEVVAGILPAESQQGTCETEADPSLAEWIYTIDVAEAAQTGLLELRVTVSQDPTIEPRPVECTLVRWILDPDAVSTAATGEASAATESTTGDAL